MSPGARRVTSGVVDQLLLSSTGLHSPQATIGLSAPKPRPWICRHCRHSSRLGTPRPVRSAFHAKFGNIDLPITPDRGGDGGSPRLYATDARRSASTRRETARVAPGSREELPSQQDERRSHAARRFSHLMDQLQSNIFIAGQRLNDLTGYSGIEALKKDIERQGW
jgi:hypothetical protein